MAARTLSIGPMLVPDESAPLRLQLFGTPALCTGGVTTRLAVPAKAVALLALLVVHFGTPQPRSRLAEILWPETTDEEARANLRRHLHLLVKTLPPDALALTKNSACWNGEQLGCDVVDFLRLSSDPRAFAKAVALRQGELCVGVHDDALGPERQTLDERYVAMLTDLANASYKTGRHPDARLYLERLVAADPLDEGHVRALMSLRRETGDRAGALREYNVLVARLRTELDVEPERETTQLFQEILYASEAGATPHNLTGETNSFVGREAELEEVGRRLAGHRLVTILGPAGIGKTRLARRSAFNQLERFPGGVWFVDLAQSSSRVDIERTVAQVLSRELTPAASSMPAILHALGAQPALLVLDNCEQVCVDAREFAAALFAGSEASVLATSRHRLEVSDESVLRLQPLPVPPETTHHNVDEVMRYPAARLFLERAATVAPWLRLTAENARNVRDILARIDGLPLAIELVAARANLLTLEGILKRLADRSTAFASLSHGAHHVTTRHSTVEASLQWSYALLSRPEQQVFARLSVFAGSFTTEAVQSVCGDLCADVLPAFSELVESSLVQTRFAGSEPRFVLLETVRAFAAERLGASADVGIAQTSHARHYSEFAQRHATEFVSGEELEAYRRCDLDANNFAAALRWSANSDHSIALRLITSLWRYWIFRWTFDEAQAVLRALLDSPVFEYEPAELRARAFQAAGMFEKERADAAAARTYFELALQQCRAANVEVQELEVLNALAILEFNHGDPAKAGRLYETCLEMQERKGDAWAAAETIANLGAVAQSINQYERAFGLFERVLEAFRAIGNERGVAYALRSLTLCCEMLERYDQGITYGNECIATYERLGEQARLADGLQTLSNLLSRMGDQRRAIALYARALHILSQVEHPIFTMLSLFGYALASFRAGDHLEAARAFAKAWTLQECKHLSLQEENRAFYCETTGQVKALLGERQFGVAWAYGKTLTINQIARAAEESAERPPPSVPV